MQRHLYADTFPERSQARLEQAGYRCEDCGIRRGAWRISRRTHEIYLVPLHAAHVNHDPYNPEAELRALCPSCHMRYDRRSEQPRRQSRRQGYRVIAVEQLLTLMQSVGIEIVPTEEGYTCSVLGTHATLPDPVEALGYALHCLMMEATHE